jgi:hypothetical protein
VLNRYERITFHKELVHVAGKPVAEFVCPGDPLLDAVSDLTRERNRDLLKRGAVLVDENDFGTGKLRFIEVKGRVAGASTVSVTKNEILTALNKPDDFILAIVSVDGSSCVEALLGADRRHATLRATPIAATD